MSKVVIAGDASGTGTFTISAPNGNTDRTLVLPDEAGTVLTSASPVSSLNATGTPDATTFLRGDGTWGAVDTTPPTGLGEIGTNIIGIKDGYYSGGLSFDFGTTYSSVYVARAHWTSSWSLMPGTWRALGGTQGYFSGINSNQHLGLFVRVS